MMIDHVMTEVVHITNRLKYHTELGVINRL